MLKQLDIYTSRLTSAFVLFFILSMANVWLDATSNIVLVLGYRLFILFTPFFFLFFKNKLTLIAFILAQIGLIMFLKDIYLIGSIFFSLGIAISGYMLKYYSSKLTTAAAWNKIAINVGSLLAGLAIIINTHKTTNKNTMIYICIFILLVSTILYEKHFIKSKLKNIILPKNDFSLKQLLSKQGIIWGLVGFVTGVKLISFASILPQLLIKNLGAIPFWYGIMIMLNSVIIVFFQLPIAKKMSNIKNPITLILPLLVAIILILLAPYLYVTTFIGAFFWVLALSIIECAITLLDTQAQKSNALLSKEAMVGIGSASCVYFVRFFDPKIGSIIIGSISILFLLLTITLFYFLKK
jgi:hypothetical protein